MQFLKDFGVSIFFILAFGTGIFLLSRGGVELDFSALLNRATAILSLSAGSLNGWRAEGGFTKDVFPGEKSHFISYLKEYLASRGASLGSSSLFDDKTQSALIDFQKNNSLPTTGALDAGTRAFINDDLAEDLCPSSDGNEQEDDTLESVSRDHELRDDYAPANLVLLPDEVRKNGIICVTEDTADALLSMMRAASNDGIYLRVTSGFRRFEIQEYLYDLYKKINGPDFWRGIASPGHSEHQLGTTVDLTGLSIKNASTSAAFGKSKEGSWMSLHAGDYGFVMSYPDGKESVTGYKYEPWHWRFVGVDVAKKVRASGKTLCEFLKDLSSGK